MTAIKDAIEWTYDSVSYRIDRDFIEIIETSIELALEDAEENEIDVLGIAFCGCEPCALRTIIAVTLSRALEGVGEGLVEKI